jgi:hypothetical protein
MFVQSPFFQWQKLNFCSRIILLFLLFAGSQNVMASHFRSSNISWEETSTNVVRIDIEQSWRWSAFGNPGVGTNVNVSQVTFGDGTSSALVLTVNEINAAQDYFVGTAVFTHVYPNVATYIFKHSDCCRIGTLQNGNNGTAMINQVIIKTGTLNSSPKLSSLPIILFTINQLNTIALPIIDVDGHPMTVSITPTSESGLTQASPPGLSLSPSGVINWTPTVTGLYSMAVTVSDGIGTSRLDFILWVTIPCTNCSNTPPNFSPPVPPTYYLIPGLNTTVTIAAIDAEGNTPVITSTAVPSGATLGPNTNPAAGQAYRIFSWTPSATSSSQTVCFTVTDNLPNGTYVGQYCIQFIVNQAPVFNTPPTPLDGTAFCVLTGQPFAQVIEAMSLSNQATNIYLFQGLPSGATTSPMIPTTPSGVASTTINWTPVPAEWGLHTLTVGASSIGLNRTRNFNFTVNSTPSFTNAPAPSTANPGSLYSHTFTGVDADIPYGDELEFHGIGIPSWLTLDHHDGTLTGTPTCDQAGTYTFDVLLEDIWHHCGPQVKQTITLTVSDSEAPIFTVCSGDITVGTDTDVCGAVVDLPSPAVSDNCGPITLIYNTSSGIFYAVGNYPIVVTATDAAGNSATCSYIVTVADDQAPTITCPQNIIVDNDPGLCGAMVNYPAASANDNCSAMLSYSSASGAFRAVGIHNITATASDAAGLSASCDFTIMVNDAESPTALCPSDTVLDATSSSGAVVEYWVFGSDNCGGTTIDQSTGSASGSTFPIDTTVNTFVITDGSGNTSTCSFTVIVLATAIDSDCDGVNDNDDVCPLGDDSIDINNDNIPDCSQLLPYAVYSAAWKCANNKILVCHDSTTICINKNALPAHFNHGDNIGPCTTCDVENRTVIEDIDFEIMTNPIYDQISLEIIGHTDQNITIEIHNVFGQLMSTQTYDHHTHDIQINLNAQQMVAGQYLVTLTAGDIRLSKKMIVIK